MFENKLGAQVYSWHFDIQKYVKLFMILYQKVWKIQKTIYRILPETLWNSIIVNMLIIGSSTTAGSDKRKTSKKNSGIPMHVHLASAVEKDKKKESSWSEHTWSKYLLFCILFLLKIFSWFTGCIWCVV